MRVKKQKQKQQNKSKNTPVFSISDNAYELLIHVYCIYFNQQPFSKSLITRVFDKWLYIMKCEDGEHSSLFIRKGYDEVWA